MKILIFIALVMMGLIVSSCSRVYRYDQTTSAKGMPQAGAININTATRSELSQLPNIGETLATRIVEFREQNGPFRRPEHLLLVDGISEKRFREIRPLIRTE